MSRGISQTSSGFLSDVFACPDCHGSLVEQQGADGAFLICEVCRTAAPIVDGLVHFNETVSLTRFESAAAIEVDPQAYSRFVEQAWRRPVFEPYAAFAPFNEATRALYPLIETLRTHLAPGDVIVDVWCRTGWTGALLAGLFPRQHVVSLWEGPSGVLGYAGYRYWLGDRARPENWTIAFADPGLGLPFADGKVGLLHAADYLHRADADPFLDECFRVSRKDGAIAFPHVHLANGQPDPFFERGGVIRHGLDYRRLLDERLAAGGRSAFVLSERALFAREGQHALGDESAMTDYNALIAVIADIARPATIGRAHRQPAESDRLILNPLIAIDTAKGRAAYDPTAMAGRADYLLGRHPVYAERLMARLPAGLSGDELRVLFWLRLAPELTIEEIRTRTGIDTSVFDRVIERLQTLEIAHAAPVGGAMASLQHFYSTRRKTMALRGHQFASLWRDVGRHYASRPLIQTEDGSAFTAGDAAEIVALFAAAFAAHGVGKDRPLVIAGATGPEAVLAIWAAWLLGTTVAPLDPAMPAAQLAETIQRVEPALVLAEADLLAAVPQQFARLALVADGAGSLAEAIADLAPLDLASLPVPGEDSPATILFTSGSTGQPKGVVLSQGALWRGGLSIAEGLGWRDGDVLLSPGGLHTMSGLRNPCVAALMAGATLVLPDARRVSHPAALAEACRRWQVTLLSGVPALVGTVTAAAKTSSLRFAPLRQVAVTGAMLSQALQAEGERAFGAPIQVYYGLTETGGFCSLVAPDERRQDDGDIGTPDAALARLVDEAGNVVPAGEAGELQIYSANLTAGYLGDPARSAALFDRGWLRTGDMARWGEAGHLILLGRRDEQIKNRFGEIVQPAAIEALLCRRDDVAEAAVIGSGDGANMKITAFVVPKRAAGGNGWLATLQAETMRALGPRQSPDRFVETTALPRLSSGKVARMVLRDQADERERGASGDELD